MASRLKKGEEGALGALGVEVFCYYRFDTSSRKASWSPALSSAQRVLPVFVFALLAAPFAMLLPPDLLPIMLGSTLSGSLARILCHPLDTAKARIQASRSKGDTGLLRALRSLTLRDAYRGFGVTFIGSAPASCVYFSTYEVVKSSLLSSAAEGSSSSSSSALHVAAHLVAGVAAEAVSCCLYVPVDVIKERMQVQGSSRAAAASSSSSSVFYSSGRDAAQQILRSSEGFRGLYKGYWATLASFGPFSAIYFALYEALKGAAQEALAPQQAQQQGGQHRKQALLPLWAQASVASAAGAGASVLTNPLDLVKLRLQVQRGDREAGSAGSSSSSSSGSSGSSSSRGRHFGGLWDGLCTIVREEGAAGLMRGTGARVAFHATSTAVALTLFERCKEAAGELVGSSRGS